MQLYTCGEVQVTLRRKQMRPEPVLKQNHCFVALLVVEPAIWPMYTENGGSVMLVSRAASCITPAVVSSGFACADGIPCGARLKRTFCGSYDMFSTTSTVSSL